ncbi:MAG: diguanylate cyclase [Gemmatimonadaceae bacterium]|nr:diguanylate cyclase [Gemmatimonadaceae bacterium]
MRLSIGQKLTLAFAAAVAILLATGVVSYRNTRELLRTTDRVAHAQESVAAADGVAAAMSQADAAARTHLLIGDDRSRRQVQVAGDSARALVMAYASRAGADPIARREAEALDTLVRHRLQRLEWSMSLHDDGAPAQAAALLATRGDSSDTDALDALIGVVRRRHVAELQSRTVAAHEGANRADFILRFGLLLVVILAPLAFLIVRNDFAMRQAAEAAILESEGRLRAATDGSLDAFYVLRALRDANGSVMDFEFVDLNARAESLLGHQRAQVLGQRLCELIPANRTLGFVEKYRRVMETGVVLEEECEVTSRDFHAAWIHHQVVPMVDGVAITSRDITERRRQEDALRALSLIDELTGLYNRRGFLTLAQQQLKLARRGHRELVLLFIDMDDFKEINDTFGHHEGDTALRRASEILKHTFRDSDIIARLGGDEFVVLATDAGKSGSEIIIQRLRRELLERNECDGFPYRLSFSVGAARFDPDAPPSIEELMAAADSMLYEQKKDRRRRTPSRLPSAPPAPVGV